MVSIPYFMMCEKDSNLILDARLENNFGVDNYPQVQVRAATFSDDPADSPDVAVAEPLPGGTFAEPNFYVPPAPLPPEPYLKADDWSLSENGSADPDDGIWEMANPDGVKSVTLKFKKWDRTSDTAMTGSGETFGILVMGHCDCPEGRLVLDVNGEGTLTFTPSEHGKGELEIVLNPININYRANLGRVRFV